MSRHHYLAGELHFGPVCLADYAEAFGPHDSLFRPPAPHEMDAERLVWWRAVFWAK
jgi:hypothetical protein